MPAHTGAEIFAYVLVDIAVIIVVARLFGRAAQAVGQPAVVGEIVAGIALGPSLLGALPGGLDTSLFPPDVVPYLKVLAQLGLVLFMFIVGLELDLTLIRGRERVAGVISLSSIVLPFAMGAGLSLVLHPLHDTVVVDGQEQQVPLLGLALFLGVAMSITAFPVLARILSDRGMARTAVGTVALAAAAVDDIVAWTLLAFVVAVVKGGSPFEVLRIVGLTVVFAVVMFGLVRPLARRLLRWYHRAGQVTPDLFAVVLVGILLSAFLTEEIGIHAIFGAFVFGAVLPREGAHQFTHELLERLEQVSVLLLLPIFFVVTGFAVDVAGVAGSSLWQLGLVLAVAVAGKVVGAYAGARSQRLPVQHSGAVAILMNTRGLTELVILTIGLELGVLTGELFTMMVLMALITTAMAGPLLRLVYPPKAIARDIEAAAKAALGPTATYRVLVCLDGPPDAAAGRVVSLAKAAAAGRHAGEVLLSRLLPAAGGTPLEVGAGALPDLAGMARAIEELEAFARAESGGPVAVRSLCRFSADPGGDLVEQAGAVDAQVVVVGAGWARAHPGALDAFDGVVVLVAGEDGPGALSWLLAPGADAAVALAADGGLLVRHRGGADGNRAVLVAARAAATAGAALVAVATDGSRSRKRLTGALDSLAAAGLDVAVATPDDPAAVSRVANAPVRAAAAVLDRLGGSEVDLREEVAALVHLRSPSPVPESGEL